MPLAASCLITAAGTRPSCSHTGTIATTTDILVSNHAAPRTNPPWPLEGAACQSGIDPGARPRLPPLHGNALRKSVDVPAGTSSSAAEREGRIQEPGVRRHRPRTTSCAGRRYRADEAVYARAVTHPEADVTYTVTHLMLTAEDADTLRRLHASGEETAVLTRARGLDAGAAERLSTDQAWEPIDLCLRG